MNSEEKVLTTDEEIFNCLNLDKPRSFFLFAGAGSGKTRSLVEVLGRFRESNIKRLRRDGQKVSIITYTNAACDEIKRRLEFDSSFYVATIHSFSWELISPYVSDIRSWLKTSLESDIADLKIQQDKAKSKTTKTFLDREIKIESKEKRLNQLSLIKKFTYNPNGSNSSRDSLSHAEVISIAADFIQNKALMQSILTRKYPVLLIDESQDTKKELVDALFEAQAKNSDHFALGMFGDTMQRIYTDGKESLGENIPPSWAKPKKEKNYRCPRRVISLINKIRSEIDDQEQIPVKENEGFVRLFIVDTTNAVDKSLVEANISFQMKTIAKDELWEISHGDVKILTLEHHMAAKRGGFSSFFDPLYEVEKLKTGLLDGSLAVVSLLSNQVLPLLRAHRKNDDFSVAKVVRSYSPLLDTKALEGSAEPVEEIKKANLAIKTLFKLWDENNDPTLVDILKIIFEKKLLLIPETILPILKRKTVMTQDAQEQALPEESDPVVDAWEKALASSFSQFEKYVQYISDESRFGTHQGIKGLEFPRVMVILDDEDARGFLFSYEKLLGAKEPSKTDIENLNDGKDTSQNRTRRLFYVTCSRAEESLAIVAYTNEVTKVKQYALDQNWFSEEEIILI